MYEPVLEQETLKVNHLNDGSTMIRVSLESMCTAFKVEPLDTETFFSFIIEGYDEEKRTPNEQVVANTAAALLLKTPGGRFYSVLGKDLLNIRSQVIGHLKENADEKDNLEFFSKGCNYYIRIDKTS